MMIALMIVFRSSMSEDLQVVLHDNGVSAYTLINNAEGKGITGSVIGSFFYPGTNSVIFAMLPADHVDKTISALKAFHASRLQSSQGRPIPFKLFSFPCTEVI